MTATSYASGFAPAYVGNGYVGTRVPAQGMGFVDGATVPTTTIVAGVWQQTPAQEVVSAAPLPGWDELRFTDGGTDYSLSSGTVSNWVQTVDMRTGAISASLDWTSPSGHTTHLAYDVLADLARPHVATVRLRLTPTWSGAARVTDVLGSGASTDLVPVSSSSVPGHRQVTLAVRTQGTGVTVAYASQLGFTTKQLAMSATHGPRNASLAIDFATQAGTTYEFSKAVGIATSQDSAKPQQAAASAAASAASAGYDGLLAESRSAWADRWRSDIVLPDDPALQRQIRAAQFYLQESIRPGTDWSISPVGLSSSGYNDHVFWDAETWMYPTLLLLHPDVASSIVNYRANTIAGARANAQATDYQGTRYAWESANDGTEQTPFFAETREFEQHITSDVAFAQWQYYLATGDRGWLEQRAGPCFRERRISGRAGRPRPKAAAMRSRASRARTSTTTTSTTRCTQTSPPSRRCASQHRPPHSSASRRSPPGRRSPTDCPCSSTRDDDPARVRGLHRRPGQAGRRGDADLSVGVAGVAHDRTE
jgi:trehalose/maltose hydrolase-like predicted phosphorylase